MSQGADQIRGSSPLAAIMGATSALDGGAEPGSRSSPALYMSTYIPRGELCRCRAYRLFVFRKEIIFMTVIKQWAGHFQASGSDKVWAAAATSDGQFLSVWGRRGTTLQSGTKTLASQEATLKEFNAKVKKKSAEGYQPVPFDDSRYGIPSFGVLDEESTMSSPDLATSEQDRTRPRYLASHATPLNWSQLQERLQQEAYGATEKVNGVRCLVACD